MMSPEQTDSPPVIHLHLLGTPKIVYLSQDFALARRQARALLFRLGSTRQPVPREELADLLWPDKPPATARRNLTRLLSYLRSQFPQPALFVLNNTAVSLNPTRFTSDLLQFAELCQSAKPGAWETAVSLYRGSFLAGFAYTNSPEFDHWLGQQQRQYEKLYLDTLRRLANHHSDRPASAIQFAQKYLTIDDLAEDIHRQLIRLYAASGDRSAALKQYERCLIVLERELGVSPLPETRAAYEAILNSHVLTTDDAVHPNETTLPGSDLPLVGREAALGALAAAYRQFHDGGVIFMTGEPGAGKSRLMQVFANGRNALVLSGSSHADGTAIPYQPVVQALRQALPRHNRWQHALPIWLAELTRLLPELPTHIPDLPAPLAMDAQQAQGRLFEALSQTFYALAAESPVLLCLDDVHWADESTKAWLLYFSRQLRGSGICLLATYRTPDEAAVASWQWVLKRAGLMQIVTVDGLAETAVTELLHHLDTKLERLAARIHAATNGNAFFVLETIRELMAREPFNENAASLPLSPTVRDAVLHRVNTLTPLARQILEVTAVLSPIATLNLIAETAGRDKLETAVALEELTHQQMLDADDHQFHIQHDLARQAIYQNISIWRRRLLHRRAAASMENAPSGANMVWAAVIATHFEQAGKTKQAILYNQKAAQHSLTVYASHEAIQYFEKALTLSQDKQTSNESLKLQISLHEALGRIFRQQAQYEKAENAFQMMQKIATTLGEQEMLAQSHLRLGQLQDSLKQYADSLDNASRAVTLATDHALDETLALALYAQAWALFRLNQLEKALPIAIAALEKSLALKNLAVQALCQNTVGAIYKFMGEYALSEQHQLVALELFKKQGDRRRVAGMFSNLGETARLRHDFEKAHALYQQAIIIATEIGERDWLVEFLSNFGIAQFQLGKLDEAENSFYAALAAANVANMPADANLYKNLCAVHLAQNQTSRALVAGQKALDLSQQSQQSTVSGEVWFLLGKVCIAIDSPILIGETVHDAKACLEESLQLFTSLGATDKADEVAHFIQENQIK